MKYIINLIFLLIIVSSCKKEDPEILDLMINIDDISRLELRADHKTLLPNGTAKMGFNIIVYTTKNVTGYIKEEESSPSETVNSEIEFAVPFDQVPTGVIKIFDESGNILKENSYSTTTDQPGTVLKFYAACGSIKSNFVDITIRELPENYEEIVVPVIFHMLIKPGISSPKYNISEDYLQEQLRVTNEIFNAKRTTDPNAGNARIVFKLAQYNSIGLLLTEKGKNPIYLNDNMMAVFSGNTKVSTVVSEYNKLIVENKFSWDPTKYLNVYIAELSASASDTADAYKTENPKLMHPDYMVNSIPGLTCTPAATAPKLSELTSVFQIGFMVNYKSFISLGSREFYLATSFAEYLGIKLTEIKKYNQLVNGDNDFCDDTYSYDSTLYPSIFKSNYLKNQPTDRVVEYFTSYNVMDYISRKNSISVDQAARIRKVITQCPDRWAYKSNFAFTGK